MCQTKPISNGQRPSIRCLLGLLVAAACCGQPAQAGVNMTGLGSFSISGTKPATGQVGYYGNAVAFVPANEDSIAQDTLVITWAQTDPNNSSRRLHLFHRITIVPSGGTPTVLCTATIPSDLAVAGGTFGSASSSLPKDLVYDPVSKKLVGVFYCGGYRVFAFDLFNTDVTVSSLSCSAITGDSQAPNEVLFMTNDGRYDSFYTTSSSNWRKISIGRSQLDGTTAWTKVDIARASFTGWYPDPSAYQYATDGYCCTGGAGFYGSSALIIRSFKNSLNGNAQECHLHLVGQTLDDAAINAYTDLGAVPTLNGNYIGYGMAFDKAGGVAYIRSGYTNDSGSASWNKIFMAQLTLDADSIAPNAVTDLAASNVEPRALTLSWTAPLDTTGIYDGAVSYDIRYSTSLIDDTNWATATEVTGEPPPSSAGTVDSMVVSGLTAATDYYFAIKSADTSSNVSLLSNVAVARTQDPDVTPPAAVTDLAAGTVKPTRLTLTWTATGDDGNTGTAAAYDLRYSTAPIDAGNFDAAAQIPGVPAPKTAGSAESFDVTGLSASTTYYFAIKVIDEWPNASAISNVPSVTTPELDVWPPAAISDLLVTGTRVRTASVQWTTPADPGAEGLAGYDLRYSTSPIDDGNWDSATHVAGEPAPAGTGTLVTFSVGGLTMDTQYYFAIKSFDGANPANVSALSNVVSGRTTQQVNPIAIHNPWIVNDRTADTRSLQTMAATFGNAYTPDGVVPGATDQDKAINEYNNFKRREYHWADDPPNRGDVVENINVFGHSLCGGQATQNSTILNAMGLHARTVTIPGHTIYEVEYGSAWHLLDTMTTMYVFDRATPPKIASCAQIAADKTLMTSAVAEGRACPGFLLCPDDPVWYSNALGSWGVLGDPGSTTPVWSMNMDLRFGEVLYRGWDAWLNQHTTPHTDADSIPGVPDAPFHHDAARDWKDSVNYAYWEPYALNQTQNYALNIGHSVSYRRWSNGIYTIAPDFGTAGYQATVYSSSNIATLNDDGQTPDLHPATTGSLANVVFHVVLPFYITDCNISGSFTRNGASDINKIYYGTTSNPTTLVWTNTSTGTTQLNNLNLRTNVFGRFDFYIKVELQANAQISDAGVSNLVISTIYEHVKHSMATLDKGTNHVTVTFDNPQDLTGNCAFKVTYRWKEYDGSGWNVDKVREQFIPTSPFTFTIDVGGSKVPRTESIQMEVTEPPPPCDLVPPAIVDLAVIGKDSAYLELGWTAVVDPCTSGQAAAYDIRYSTAPITAGNFDAATPVANPPSPGSGGASESFTVDGLQADTTYYLALKVQSFGGSWSDLSNVVSGKTDPPDVTPPAWIKDLVAQISRTGGGVDLTWTATGDDGSTGKATSYDLRYSTSPITEANFAAATQVSGVPAPKTAGSAESFTVTGLTGGTFYYFALKVTDNVANVSEVSNCTYAYASGLGEKVLQNGLNSYGGCRDNYVELVNPTTKYGTYERMRVTAYADQGDIQRGFIKFDLTSIPPGTTVRSAVLQLYSYDISKMNGSTGYYGLYRFTRTWSETGSCYNQADTGVNWTTPGGDFEATPDATTPKKAPKVPSWYEWNVTTRTQQWINDGSGNFGWCVKGTVETTHNQDQFYQSDTVNAEYRPKLIISDYLQPGPGDINGDGAVDVADLLFLAQSFGGQLGQRTYDPKCDLNADDVVDVSDLLLLAACWQ